MSDRCPAQSYVAHSTAAQADVASAEASRPCDHWASQFPELVEMHPQLEIIRYVHALAIPGQTPEQSEQSSDYAQPLEALFAQLHSALGVRLDVAAPGAPGRSFDERWLIALFDALRGADLTRYQFLLRSRLSAGAAARAHFALTQAQVWLDSRI